ncbi:MAG TPA: hypothetical protein VGI73_08450 [Solirubrobacterales bacterium]|jgi:hypothetical protein
MEQLTWWALRLTFLVPHHVTRPRYMRLLRETDRLFMRVLALNGAVTAVELVGQLDLTAFSKEATAPWPTRATVDDWLLLAYRRGLLMPFSVPAELPLPSDGAFRWTLTADGRAAYRRPVTELWWAGKILKHLTQFVGWLAALALGSAVIVASLGRVEWGKIVSSDAFLLAVLAVFYAVLFTLANAANRRVFRPFRALFIIELTRSRGTVSSMEVESEDRDISSE